MVDLDVFFFFFSSRRRHTRFDCDWSSDVCSSDLSPAAPPRACRRAVLVHVLKNILIPVVTVLRSEERRVGKECRCRWLRKISKKNIIRGTPIRHEDDGDNVKYVRSNL